MGHTKGIFIVSAKTLANAAIKAGYIASASLMAAIDGGLEALPVTIKNNEFSKLEAALKDKKGGSFSSN